MRQMQRLVSMRAGSSIVAVAAAGLCASAAWAQAPAQPSAGIYTCIDSQGRRLTSDRPIAECTAREQQVLNRDGSVRRVVPPTLTAEERAEKEARERAAAQQRAAQSDAMRRDRNLMLRYPDEAAHSRAREGALDAVRAAMKAGEVRLRELAGERKPLLDEAEFYQAKSLPPKLKAALDANDAAVEAQRQAAATQQAELGRVNRNYDIELERLRKLWAGAAPGSLGVLPEAAAAQRPAAKAVSQQAARPAAKSADKAASR
jgi:hypothetical protein